MQTHHTLAIQYHPVHTGFPLLSSVAKPSDFPVLPAPSEINEEGQEENTALEGVQETRPSTPPPRAEAFEQFKREKGSEINKILLLNKGKD